MTSSTHQPPLDRQIIRTVYLFQAIIAGPTFVVLGCLTFFSVWSGVLDFYYFATWLCTSLMAAGIIFIVVIQRKAVEGQISRRLGLLFESCKAGFATGLWIWLMVDSIVKTPDDAMRKRRIASSALAGILLVFFYATLFWTVRDSRRRVGTRRGVEAGEDEQTPLLQEL